MTSTSSEQEAGEAPAKKPWSRPTFYVLTDVIESHGGPTAKAQDVYGNPASREDEVNPATPKQKNYVPTSL